MATRDLVALVSVLAFIVFGLPLMAYIMECWYNYLGKWFK